MASIGGASIQDDLVRGIIGEVKQLTVDRLKRVLRSEGQLMSGVKTELQTRIIAHILDAERRNDQAQIRRIRDAIRGYPYSPHTSSSHSSTTNSYAPTYSGHTSASSVSPTWLNNLNNSSASRLPPPVSSTANNMPQHSGYQPPRTTFKPSPFYTIQRPISAVMELKAREQTRDTARIPIQLDEDTLSKLQKDPNLRIFVFCAAESYDYKPQDIAFPTHAELRVNQEDLKVNLKGLKNKPGSTRPVDITSFLRKKASFPNSIELVYALTNKGSLPQKFLLLVNLVQKRPIDSLVEELKRGKSVSRERVIRDMQSRAKDDDIVTLTSNMTLKDPVQMTRIETPCRSMACKHNECFDAAVFLNLQEQAPTWICPLCNKPAAWDTLFFDQYFQHILQNTPSDAELVTVEPDGSWHLPKTDNDDDTSRNSSNQRANGLKNDDDDDEDLVEITDLDGPKMAIRPRDSISHLSIRTPPIGGRDSSFTPSFTPSAASTSTPQPGQPQSQSKKRPREEVIDLTLSDDDEDQPPVSRIKRPSLSSHLSDSNNRPPPGAGPYRLTLPPVPNARTSSPANYFDHFNTRL